MRRVLSCLSVLFAILLSYPAVSGAVGGDLGKATLFDLQFFELPIGANPHSDAVDEKNGEREAKRGEQKDKKILDKKVDDAIKKAFEEK